MVRSEAAVPSELPSQLLRCPQGVFVTQTGQSRTTAIEQPDFRVERSALPHDPPRAHATTRRGPLEFWMTDSSGRLSVHYGNANSMDGISRAIKWLGAAIAVCSTA